jgi:hypothetical protein
MDSVFAGTPGVTLKHEDDRQYCKDLGLVTESANGKLRPANAIYREIMSRLLTDQIQEALDDDISKIKWTDGQVIHISALLKSFQIFWRENAFTFPLRINKIETHTNDVITKELNLLPLSSQLSEVDSLTFIGRVKDAIARQYDEAAYSLLLFSYLQKVMNGGALVYRQFAQGCGAVDLFIQFKNRKYLVEIKLLGQRSLESSLEQIKGYLDISDEKEGWLVIFDRDRNKSWEEKISWETTQFEGVKIHIVGC